MVGGFLLDFLEYFKYKCMLPSCSHLFIDIRAVFILDTLYLFQWEIQMSPAARTT